MNEQELMAIDIESRRNFLINFEWMISVLERYSNPHEFGLVLIEYGEKHALGETFGALKAMEQLIAVTESIKKTFRKTDIVGRYGANFWIIVPGATDNENVLKKILYVLQESKHQGLNVVDREISIYSLPPETIQMKHDFQTPDKFLDYLIEHKKQLATQMISINAESKSTT